jgi:ubiquinol oxidase
VATRASDPPGAAPGPDRRRGAIGELDHDGLLRAQADTERTPRRHYGIAARILFGLLDALYGKPRTLSKFKVLELVARVPYQSWEQVAYIAITHAYEHTGLARRIYDRVSEARAQQDNEQWHLLILEERIVHAGVREGWVRFRLIPQVLAFLYYQLSWLLYVIRPSLSYRLNADFEDHAEHEYMAWVSEHPEWEEEAFTSAFADDYAKLDSVADLFRQIGYDEWAHKHESLARMAEPRFR